MLTLLNAEVNIDSLHGSLNIWQYKLKLFVFYHHICFNGLLGYQSHIQSFNSAFLKLFTFTKSNVSRIQSAHHQPLFIFCLTQVLLLRGDAIVTGNDHTQLTKCCTFGLNDESQVGVLFKSRSVIYLQKFPWTLLHLAHFIFRWALGPRTSELK